MLSTGVLQITDLQPEDAGKYRCKAVNQLRDRHSDHAILTVSTGTGHFVSVTLSLAAFFLDTDIFCALGLARYVLPVHIVPQWHVDFSVSDTDMKPARFVIGPQDQALKVGETAVFECLATGLPLPGIVWTREGIKGDIYRGLN